MLLLSTQLNCVLGCGVVVRLCYKAPSVWALDAQPEILAITIHDDHALRSQPHNILIQELVPFEFAGSLPPTPAILGRWFVHERSR